MPDMPGAADADHVHPLQLGRQLLGAHRSPSAPRATSSATCGHPSAASGCPAWAAAAVIAASRCGSVSSPPTCRATKLRSQVGVVDEQAAAGVDHRQCVEPLFAVADRQRHVHRGQADRRHLGHRHRTGPADRQVGGGVGQIHPVQVGHRDVRRITRAGGAQFEGVLGAVGVQHRNARARPGPRRPRRRPG